MYSIRDELCARQRRSSPALRGIGDRAIYLNGRRLTRSKAVVGIRRQRWRSAGAASVPTGNCPERSVGRAGKRGKSVGQIRPSMATPLSTRSRPGELPIVPHCSFANHPLELDRQRPQKGVQLDIRGLERLEKPPASPNIVERWLPPGCRATFTMLRIAGVYVLLVRTSIVPTVRIRTAKIRLAWIITVLMR